jgi:16S rRNA (cytidine1402-2'-O)-methyltransferase
MSEENLEPAQNEELSDRPLAPGLYLVGTPIGNLGDITLRAIRVLRSADRIACEDTRQTQKLLNHFGITTPTVSCHQHNEAERIPEFIAAMQKGSRIAVVSDAGMPGISDPGMHLAAAAIDAGIAVYPVPGANAALSALVASGLNTERFLYAGFLPAKAGARRAALEKLASDLEDKTTLVLYEAPHRILETLGDVQAVWGDACRVAVARELTKLHEEFLRGSVAEVKADLASRDRIRGEITLLIEASATTSEAVSSGSIADRIAALQQIENLDEKDALKRVARERGISKSEAYRELQRERARR